MPAKLIDGEALAAKIKADLAPKIAAFKAKTGAPPKLASILVGPRLTVRRSGPPW